MSWLALKICSKVLDSWVGGRLNVFQMGQAKVSDNQEAENVKKAKSTCKYLEVLLNSKLHFELCFNKTSLFGLL